MCADVSAPAQDRAVGQVQSRVSHPIPVLVHSFAYARDIFSAEPVKPKAWKPSSLSLVIGSPPQAKLRVWLL
jgi:hypothetical protein